MLEQVVVLGHFIRLALRRSRQPETLLDLRGLAGLVGDGLAEPRWVSSGSKLGELYTIFIFANKFERLFLVNIAYAPFYLKGLVTAISHES